MEQWVNSLPPEQIQRGITYTLQQLAQGKVIANIGGYLQRMVRMKDLVDPTKEKQEKQKKQQQQRNIEDEKRRQQKASLEEEHRLVYQQLVKEEGEIIRAIFAEDPDIREKVIEVVKSKPMSLYDSTLSVEENLKKPFFLASFKSTVRNMYPERFTSLEPYEAQGKALKMQMQRL